MYKNLRRVFGFYFAIFMMSQTAYSQDKAFLYYHADPSVAYKGDTATQITLTVATSGQGISKVRIIKPVQSDMFDDGTHGDKTAGDGIFALDQLPVPGDLTIFSFAGTHGTGHFEISIDKVDGSWEEYLLTLGIVEPSHSFPSQQVGDGMFATEYAFFIIEPDGESLAIDSWPLGAVKCGEGAFSATQKLYSVFPDMFDFVVVMPAVNILDPERNYVENSPYFVRAKNEIENIGIDLFDNTADFGSQGRLMGMIYHSWGDGQILDHEIGHAWSADIGESLGLTWCPDCGGNHWNPLATIGGQIAAFLFHPQVQYGAGHLKDNGNGSFRIERDPDDNQLYSELDLYIMGLIPASEVSPIKVLVNPNLSDHENVTADTVRTVTIEEIMQSEGGERVPSFQNSQKDFNAAFIVVKEKAFTPAEFAYYSLIAIYFSSREQGVLSLTTFHTATGGRATLDFRLPVTVNVTEAPSAPANFKIRQNYPNPFNPSTTISFLLPGAGDVTLSIFNSTGQAVRTLVNERKSAGMYEAVWNGRNDAGARMLSGVYFYRLEVDGFVQSRKLLLLK